MERLFSFSIHSDEEGMKLVDFLRKKGFSRHMLTNLKEVPQGLLLNGAQVYGSCRLKAGDLVRVRLLDTEASPGITPVPMDLTILYEDEDLLVINKAADTPIHPSFGNHENTLANAVAWYFAQKGETYVYRCINRLDRDTTGALILAKNAYSASLLGEQMKNRRIRRTYLALAEGKIPDRGTINAPIGRAEGSAILRTVDFQKGEPACTHFERLAYQNGLSLTELHLETGRTHQIRIHMGFLGYPLIGDYLYYPKYDRISRQALHSCQLEFYHPVTGQPLLFQAPVPQDMVNAFMQKQTIKRP